MNTPQQIDLETRKQLISNHQLFVLLTPDDITELAALLQEQSMQQGDIIVKEGDIIDAFFLIAAGDAEVIREIKTVEESRMLSLAILHPGETIGLSPSGIFSADNKRTATVRAKTDVILLKIDLTVFNQFINAPTRLYPNLREASGQLMRSGAAKHSDKDGDSKEALPKKSFFKKLLNKIF